MESVPSRTMEMDLSENSEDEGSYEIVGRGGEQNNTENNDGLSDEPKAGLTFDTLDEAFLFYASYAKKSGFGAAKRSSKKKNGVPKNCTLPRPETKTGCLARKNVKERKRTEQKKNEQKEKQPNKDKLKKVPQEVLPDLNDDFVVQESFPVYSEQFMWTNIEQSVPASQVWGSNVPSSSSFRDYF